MSTTDYLIDTTLVLLVLLQIKERKLTTQAIVRPVVILGVAVANYLHGIPTAGNDLLLITVLALIGATIGIASGVSVVMRHDGDGDVLARAGWTSAFYWVLGMGSRFAFLVWATHGGAASIGTFSIEHSLTAAAWTPALLGMAAFEVLGRSLILALRRRQLTVIGTPELA